MKQQRQQRIEGKRPKRRILWLSLISVFGLLLALSCYIIVHNMVQNRREQAAFDALTRLSQQQAEEHAKDPSDPSIEPEEETSILPKLAPLYEENAHLAGWLTVPGTGIDYPVMLTPEDPEYYLSHAFDGKKSRSGVPFIGQGSTTNSRYLIIYGHNLRNNIMFSSLELYKSEDFWEQNPTFRFDTLYDEQEYEIFAAVECRILYQNEAGFRYYQVPADFSEAEFNELIDWLTHQTLYDTGITPIFGDQILILSTCSYHTDNGRFIVAARKSK